MSKWLTFEDDLFIIVVPETDIKPHGFPVAGNAELASTDCPCRPKIVAGKNETVFRKPMLIHHSFEDMVRVDDAIENPRLLKRGSNRQWN